MPSFKFLLLLWALFCLMAVVLACHHGQATPRLPSVGADAPTHHQAVVTPPSSPVATASVATSIVRPHS